MAKYTLEEIAKSFYQKRSWEKQFPINYHLVRPFSFLITYLFLRITSSPSRVAWAGFIVGLSGCFSFLGIQKWTVWPGIILISIFSLLDAVDGNIARTTGKVTHYGKFLDSVLGEIIEASYCFSIGFGIFFTNSHPLSPGTTNIYTKSLTFLPLICGFAILAGRVLSSYIDLKYDYYSLEKLGDKHRSTKNIDDAIKSSTYRERWYYRVFINFNLLNNQILLLLCFVWLGNIAVFLYIISFYYICRFIVYFLFFVKKASYTLT